MMKLLLLLLLLLSSTAFAESTFDLSCDNVARIRIGRMDDTYWNVESYQGSYQGSFHVVAFDLKKGAVAQFARLGVPHRAGAAVHPSRARAPVTLA